MKFLWPFFKKEMVHDTLKMVPNEALRQIIDENMHQSYNFKAVSLMKKRITVFKVSNDFHTQKHRVWHQKTGLLHQAKLNIYSLKWFWTSYIPFLTFRSIWCLWKWSQMIPHTPKQNQNHVSSMLRSWVRISHLEVLLDLLQPVHSVLGLQVDLEIVKLVQNDSSWPKRLVLPPEPCF